MQPIQSHVQRLIDSGFTQVEIEEKTGVPQATVSRILTGKHADPRSSTVEKLRQLKPKPQRRRKVPAVPAQAAEPIAA